MRYILSGPAVQISGDIFSEGKTGKMSYAKIIEAVSEALFESPLVPECKADNYPGKFVIVCLANTNSVTIYLNEVVFDFF